MLVGNTLIRLADGSEIPIENLYDSSVQTYDRHGACFVRNAQLTAINSCEYTGPTVTVSTAGKTVESTPNHPWLVRWTNQSLDKWVTYLMRRHNWFRVGSCQLFYKGASRGRDKETFILGLGSRCRGEQASAGWIIQVHNSAEEAFIHEQILAASYGLPQIRFKGWGCHPDSTVKAVYSNVQGMEARAIQLLTDHYHSITYPLYKGELRQRQGRTTLFETEACNLLSTYMAIPLAEDSKDNYTLKRGQVKWNEIDVTPTEYSGRVYSGTVGIKVQYNRIIANSLVTCSVDTGGSKT